MPAGLGSRRVAILKTGVGREKAACKVARSALEASASRGFGVASCAAVELDKLRSVIFSAASPGVAGRPRAPMLMPTPFLDPMFRATLMPIMVMHGAARAQWILQRIIEYVLAQCLAARWPQVKGAPHRARGLGRGERAHLAFARWRGHWRI